MSKPNNSIANRLIIFIAERYAFPTSLISAVFMASGLYLLSSPDPKKDIHLLILGALHIFLYVLAMRICDEFKDKEADAKHFPERCMPSGRVLFSDIKVLLVFTLIAVLIIGFLAHSYFWFAIDMVYLFLFAKYFFFPKQISNNLLLALLTHNPIVLITNLYVISIYKEGVIQGSDVAAAILFWMPGFIWETSRKIRIKSDETLYQTYSMMLGLKGALILPALGAFLQTLVIKPFVSPLQYTYFSFITLIFWAYLIRIALYKNPQDTRTLQKKAEVYLGLFSAFLIGLSCLEKLAWTWF